MFKMSTQEAEKERTSQPLLFDVSSRQRAKENEADGAIHDFVRALAYTETSMHQADGPLGDMVKIREDMQVGKVSVIVDESPYITGVPTINTEADCFGRRRQSKYFGTATRWPRYTQQGSRDCRQDVEGL